MSELRVLGALEIAGSDGVLRPPAAKQRRLLAALALAAGRAWTTDELVEAVWAGSPPASARKLLQIYVSQLRKLLPEGLGIATRSAGYELELGDSALDATRFERLLDDAAAARRDGNAALALSLADRALALWRGPAYADVAYDEFARGEAERLEERRLEAVEERLQALLDLGRHGEALGDLLALADEHPRHERLQALAMLTLYRCGRQTDALDLYATVRQRLDDELGLEPGAELRALQRRILNQDAMLDAVENRYAVEQPLPEPPNPLVGRERELEHLTALLQNRTARLLVLTGAGGSGKTRLALGAAGRAAGSYANGAVLVELGPLRDPDLVVPTIANAVQVAESADTPLVETLAAALRQRELLLVLDNAEHLREAAPVYVELLARAPRLTLLVTSRAVLHVSGEHVFPVAPLDAHEAVALFVQRARALRPDFELTEANEDDVGEICRRLDGLPLAVELAAARIGLLTPAAIRERLASRLTLLTGGPRDLPARQQTLRETLDWSAGLLDDAQRRVLARLAVFPGGATIDAAEIVCEADLDTLEALVHHSLVRRTDAAGEPRFGLLETVREYAVELLGEERGSVEHVLATYLAELLERGFVRWHHDPNRWLERQDAELDNFRAAIDYAIALGDDELELRLTGYLWRYWWVRGAPREGLASIERALERTDGSPTIPRAHSLAGAAGLASASGDNRRAKFLAEEALAVARASGGTLEEGLAHTVLGIAAGIEREFATARAHHARSIDCFERLGLEPAHSWANLAAVTLAEGDAAAAVPLFEDVLAWHTRRGAAGEGSGLAHLNLGLAKHRLGDTDAARRHFEQARMDLDAIGFRAHVGHALQGLAATEVVAGRHREAARLLGRSSALLGGLEWSTDDFDFHGTLAAEAERAARTVLGDGMFDAAFAEGRATVSA